MPHKDPAVAKAYWLARRKTDAHKQYQQELRARKHAEDPGHRADGQLRYKYGISLVQYNALFAAQAGCCAICATHQSAFARKLHVDHCHRSGRVRGLLCTNCNTAIGKLQDSVPVILMAARYLEAAKALPDMPKPEPKRKGRPPKERMLDQPQP